MTRFLIKFSGIALSCVCSSPSVSDAPIATGVMDPEMQPVRYGRGITFATPTSEHAVWYGAIHPVTGLCLHSGCQTRLLSDSSVVVPFEGGPINGPEWGCGADGQAVYYNRLDASGVIQAWRWTPGSGVTQLTHQPEWLWGHLMSCTDSGTVYGHSKNPVTLTWWDENDPDVQIPLDGYAGRWIGGQRRLAYLKDNQVYVLDADTGSIQQITGSPGGRKKTPIPYTVGTTLLIAVVVNEDHLVVFDDSGVEINRATPVAGGAISSLESWQQPGCSGSPVMLSFRDAEAIHVAWVDENGIQSITQLETEANPYEPEPYCLRSGQPVVYYNSGNGFYKTTP